MAHQSLPASSAVKSKLALAVAKSMLLTALGCLVIPTNVMAETAPDKATASDTQQFNIAAGSLENALNQLGQQAGVLLSYSPELTTGKQSNGLTGRYSFSVAVALLLQDTGLVAQQQDDGSYTISSREVVEYELDDVTVRGTLLSRYEYDRADSASGFETDVDLLPRSVQVLPEQLILDQNAERITDVLVNAASVSRSDGFGGAQDEVFIRGMDNNHLFVDGSPVSARSRVDVAVVERLEVVSGPASVLHGQVSPGGLINIVTKKPQRDSAHMIQAMLDDQGRQKITADSTGSVTDDVQYRVVISDENSGSFREVKTEDGTTEAKTKNRLIAPSISYTPDSYNTFTLSLSHSDKTAPIDRGTVAFNDGNGNTEIADIPRDRRLGSEFSTRDSIEKRASFDFDHEFRSGWINRFKVSYAEKQFDDYQARPTFGLNGVPSNLLELIQLRNSQSVQANGLLVRTADTNVDVKESDLFFSDSLSGDFELGGVNNTLYVGVNYTKRELDKRNGIALQDITGALAPPTVTLYALDLNTINIYDEVRPAYEKREQKTLNDEFDKHTEYGFSIQNLSYLTDDMTLLTGLRYDNFELKRDSDVYFADGPAAGTYAPLADTDKRQLKSKNDNISGQLGLLYQIKAGTSVYASYSESFLPNYPNLSATEGLKEENLAPEEANQYELGVKSSMLDDKLRLLGSVYHLTRENVWSVDNNFVSNLNGKEETKGVEFSATMQFVPGLNVLASITHMDARIVNDNNDDVDNEGNRPKSVPQQKGRAWGSYEFQNGKMAGLGFGLGAEYVGDRQGDDNNSFELPGYTLLDVASWYYLSLGDTSRLRLQAGVKNLEDKEYYPASINAFRINVGEPRTTYLSARLEF